MIFAFPLDLYCQGKWEIISYFDNGSRSDLSIYFLNEQYGFVSGGDEIARTTDGGGPGNGSR